MSTIAIGFGVAAILTASDQHAAAPPLRSTWIPILSASGPLEAGPHRVDATIVEASAPPPKTLELIGNSSVQRNDSARQLRLRVHGRTGTQAVSLYEVTFPSVSVPGDPCSVRRPEKLEVKHGRVVLSVHYEYACGAGSGGDATFTLARRDGGFQLDRLVSSYASREGGVDTVFDYQRKLLIVQRDRPENVLPPMPLRRRLATAAPRWPNISFEQCPRPRQHAALPEC